MTSRHRALVVEDDTAAVEEARLALAIHEIDCVAVDNKKDAILEIEKADFCLILVDLEIKPERGDLRGHVEAGHEFVRYARKKYQQRNDDRHHTTQIIVVSAHVKEGEEAREVFRAGADDMAQKMSGSRLLPERIKQCMVNSGRTAHEFCGALASRHGAAADSAGPFVIEILGERDGRRRRTTVTIGGQEASLTDGSLLTLLRLMLAKCKGKRLHSDTDFGSRKKNHGARLVSRLIEELRADFPHELVTNERGKGYALADAITVGTCNIEKLALLRNDPVSKLAAEVERHRQAVVVKRV